MNKNGCRKCEKDEFVRLNPGVPVNLRAEVHSCEKDVRFLFKDKKAAHFVYLPSKRGPCQVQDATMGVKFAQRTVILDDWYLFGGTRWTRTLFRLRHPIVYSKRGLRNVYRRIKRFFFGDPPMILCRKWVTPEEAKKHWPDKK